MAILIVVIQMVFLSLAMAEQELTTDLDGWWYLVKPVQISSTSGSPLIEQSVRRDDYTYTPGIGGYKVHTNSNTWNDARKICEEEGGHLAIINSIAEANVISNLYRKAGHYVSDDENNAYIGVHDMFEHGDYVTIQGQSLAKVGFIQWGTGEPDNAGAGEHCVTMHRDGNLNDYSCSKSLGFICELPSIVY